MPADDKMIQSDADEDLPSIKEEDGLPGLKDEEDKVVSVHLDRDLQDMQVFNASAASLFIVVRQDFHAEQIDREELKKQIAVSANKVLTSSEKSVAALRKLLALCRNPDTQVLHPLVSSPGAVLLLQIQRLAMLSCMRVFKDIVPGYRIETNVLSTKDQEKKVNSCKHTTVSYHTAIRLTRKASKRRNTSHFFFIATRGI